MPLIKSKSDKAFKSNIKAEIAAGKPVKQAVAIAYSTKRAAKKASGGSMSPHSYDSDWDYYRATGQMNDGDDEGQEQREPKVSKVGEYKKAKSEQRAAGSAKTAEMYRSTDKKESERQFGRIGRRKESNRLKDTVERITKSGEPVNNLIAKQMRKEWSEKIGGGKPAPFKSGGKAKACW
jgi:hypothetical protein